MLIPFSPRVRSATARDGHRLCTAHILLDDTISASGFSLICDLDTDLQTALKNREGKAEINERPEQHPGDVVASNLILVAVYKYTVR